METGRPTCELLGSLEDVCLFLAVVYASSRSSHPIGQTSVALWRYYISFCCIVGAGWRNVSRHLPSQLLLTVQQPPQCIYSATTSHIRLENNLEWKYWMTCEQSWIRQLAWSVKKRRTGHTVWRSVKDVHLSKYNLLMLTIIPSMLIVKSLI